MRLTYIRSTISTLSPQTQSQTLASWTSSRFAVWRCTSTRRWTTRPSRRSWRRPSGCTTKKVSPCRWTRSRPNRIVCRQPTMRPIGWHWGAISRRSLHEMCFEKHTTTQPTNNKHIHTHTPEWWSETHPNRVRVGGVENPAGHAVFSHALSESTLNCLVYTLFLECFLDRILWKARTYFFLQFGRVPHKLRWCDRDGERIVCWRLVCVCVRCDVVNFFRR